jgi:hypothetical protein
MEIRENNILFFIGAGCSADANIKLSYQMVKEVERLITEVDDWKKYRDLYFYLKSTILYNQGLKGNFLHNFNIEELLTIIGEIIKKDKNPIYPFIGNWNNNLLELSGKDFSLIEELDKQIRHQLIEWVKKDDYSDAQYYLGFSNFTKEVGISIRIFSLNYDLCVEEVLSRECDIELGFDKKSNNWHFSNIESADRKERQIILYKLHGSIDWKRRDNESNILFKCAHPDNNPIEIIFGTDNKLKSTDPYLFYTYQFRHYSLNQDCKIILIIGYSFNDEYLNELLKQAMLDDKNRKIIVIEPVRGKVEPKTIEIQKKLKLKNKEQIIVLNNKAKTFLETKLSKEYLMKFLTDINESPFK